MLKVSLLFYGCMSSPLPRGFLWGFAIGGLIKNFASQDDIGFDDFSSRRVCPEAAIVVPCCWPGPLTVMAVDSST